MASYQKYFVFVKDLAHGYHDLSTSPGDLLKVALTSTASVPASTKAILANLTEISYTNLSSRDLTISASNQTSGVFKLVLDDLVLTATGSVGPFRYVSVYNDSSTAPVKPLIAWYDHASNVTLSSGETFTIDFSSTNGFFQIA